MGYQVEENYRAGLRDLHDSEAHSTNGDITTSGILELFKGENTDDKLIRAAESLGRALVNQDAEVDGEDKIVLTENGTRKAIDATDAIYS